jgi:hypothetical protein
VQDTALVRFPLWIFHQTAGKALGLFTASSEATPLEDGDSNDEELNGGVSAAAKATANGNGTSRRRAKKAGGKR